MARIDPHSYTDPDQGVVTTLDLRLSVDFSSRQLSGTARLTLDKAGAGPLDLDTRALSIARVTDAAGKTLDYSLADAEGFMGARLTVDRPAAVDQVTIAYTTSPEASALQWLEPQHTAGKEKPFLFSQCQPHHARSMVPIQDSPRVRFSYSAELTVPEPLVAVMSAAPGERKPGAVGQAIYSFAMPQPIPAYLLALAVGKLASRELGPRSRVYAEPETVEAAAYEFEAVDSMLREAEGLFGTYAWERFDFIVLPPAFPYGGMENPRLTFLTPTLIAGDRSLVNVLAHELAHSWTGNLVTNATMNDFWLNEGFTVWAERRILEQLEGEDALALAAVVGRDALDSAIKTFGADSPYTRLENDLEGVDPDEIYSTVPYEKGFLFVTLLERTLGRTAFDAWLRDYLEHFNFTSITTGEFEAYVEKTQPGLLEKVGAEQWLRGPGIPDNAAAYSSKKLETISELVTALEKDRTFDPAATAAFSTDEWQLLLERLPRPLPEETCAWLDQSFELTGSGNSEILCKWLVIAISSNYQPAFDRLRSFLASVGRMKFLKPIYKALHETAATKAMAAEIFETCKEAYHPIARGGIERILASD